MTHGLRGELFVKPNRLAGRHCCGLVWLVLSLGWSLPAHAGFQAQPESPPPPGPYPPRAEVPVPAVVEEQPRLPQVEQASTEAPGGVGNFAPGMQAAPSYRNPYRRPPSDSGYPPGYMPPEMGYPYRDGRETMYPGQTAPDPQWWQ